jgi:CRP-like cAMP-binding protein
MHSIEPLAVLPMFSGVPPEALRELTLAAPLVQFKRDAMVLKQGEPAADALLVVSGRLRMYVSAGGTLRALGTIRPGEVFGEEGIYCKGSRRSITVVAREDTQCLLLTPAVLRDRPGGEALVAVERHLLRVLSRRIRRSGKGMRDAWKETRQAQAEGEPAPGLRERLLGLFRKGE